MYCSDEHSFIYIRTHQNGVIRFLKIRKNCQKYIRCILHKTNNDFKIRFEGVMNSNYATLPTFNQAVLICRFNGFYRFVSRNLKSA